MNLRTWYELHPIRLGLSFIIAFSVLRAMIFLIWNHYFDGLNFEPTLPFLLFTVCLFIVLSLGLIVGGLHGLAGVSWQRLGWAGIMEVGEKRSQVDFADLSCYISLLLSGGCSLPISFYPLHWHQEQSRFIGSVGRVFLQSLCGDLRSLPGKEKISWGFYPSCLCFHHLCLVMVVLAGFDSN